MLATSTKGSVAFDYDDAALGDVVKLTVAVEIVADCGVLGDADVIVQDRATDARTVNVAIVEDDGILSARGISGRFQAASGMRLETEAAAVESTLLKKAVQSPPIAFGIALARRMRRQNVAKSAKQSPCSLRGLPTPNAFRSRMERLNAAP